MRKELLAIMPEFKLIKDPELREKTITAWVNAIEEGGWTIDDLKQMPFTLLIEETSVNIIEHTRAVTLSSLEIAEVMADKYKGKISLNRDYLVSGALLHDVGKLFEYKKEKGKFVKSRGGELLRHPISGAAFASQLGQSSSTMRTSSISKP
jgi:putative nucleotidyltransferase with HDIG domain